MKAEEIDQLEAGREFDCLIAEKVMGWTEVGNGQSADCDFAGKRPGAKFWGDTIPRYSTEIGKAWLVVEPIRGKIGARRNLFFRIPSQTGIDIWSADSADMKNGIMLSSAESAPLAICRAALRIVMRGKE